MKVSLYCDTFDILLFQVEDLALVGVDSTSQCVRRVMKNLLSNSLAKMYNWKGKGEKYSFCALLSCKAVKSKHIQLVRIMYYICMILSNKNQASQSKPSAMRLTFTRRVHVKVHAGVPTKLLICRFHAWYMPQSTFDSLNVYVWENRANVIQNLDKL